MDRRTLIGLRILAQGLLARSSGGTRGSSRRHEHMSDVSSDCPARPFDSAHAAVRAFGAHQGQDLAGAVASVALRTSGDVQDVTDAFSDGRIVRGYPMRGTVFVTSAADLRWMTQLCASPAIRAAQKRRPALGLDDTHVTRAADILLSLTRELSRPGRGPGVPRAELFDAWSRGGVDPSGGRGYHLLVHLISTGVAVYGPWTGSDTAVVDAAQWLPARSGLADLFDDDRTAATAELLRRYLLSHGPATLRDFAWWTKLPLGTARAALPLIEDSLETCAIPGTDEPAYFRPGLRDDYAKWGKAAMKELLLPGFDELVLGYPDRLALMDSADHTALVPGNNGVFKRAAIRRGQVVGTWTRTGAAGRRRLALTPLKPVSDAQRKRFDVLFGAFPYTSL